MLDLCSLRCRSSRSSPVACEPNVCGRGCAVCILLFAGLGSLFSLQLSKIGRLRRHPTAIAIGALSVIALVYLQLLPPIFHRFLASSDILKITVSIGLIAPLAFFMGMPFPLGISWLQRHEPHLIAWAWGINGYASVVSAILATCLAIAFGFNTVILLAVGVYLIGGCIHLRLDRETAPCQLSLSDKS